MVGRSKALLTKLTERSCKGETIAGSTGEAPLAKPAVQPESTDRRGVDTIAARAAAPTEMHVVVLDDSCE